MGGFVIQLFVKNKTTVHRAPWWLALTFIEPQVMRNRHGCSFTWHAIALNTNSNDYAALLFPHLNCGYFICHVPMRLFILPISVATRSRCICIAVLPSPSRPSSRSAPASRSQGLTLVHFSAQRKHVLWDTLGAWFPPSLLDRGTPGSVTKTA